jgi:hypothetical protein
MPPSKKIAISISAALVFDRINRKPLSAYFLGALRTGVVDFSTKE